MKVILLFILILALYACKRGGDGIESFGSADILSTENQDKFLEFFNRQASLPADKNYQLVIGTETTGDSGDFAGTITFDDGNAESFSGVITSGFAGATGANNARISFDMEKAGGIQVNLNSSVATCLYLLNENNNAYIGPAGIVDDVPDGNCKYTTQLNISPTQTDTAQYAKAYYEAVDPSNERDTLEKWKNKNGFGDACTPQTESKFGQCEVSAFFRDTKDLGYGRIMHARRVDSCSNPADTTATCSTSNLELTSFAIYVENFQVDAIPGQQYSELNLDAVINDSRQWHFGTNAIEFNNEGSTNDELYSRFYTFVADDSSNNGNRLEVVDLDERGEKAVPANCLNCHGGSAKRLLADNFSLAATLKDNIGDLQGQLKPIEVNTLQFADIDGYRQSDQEPALTFMNQGILDAYKVLQTQNNSRYKQAFWNPSDAITLVEGWYGGVDANGKFNNDTFDKSYVLPGWVPNASASGTPVPDGADEIFREVILPNCLNCHLARGNYINTVESLTSYSDFVVYNDVIESYVYEQANMPSSALNYENFWENPSVDKAKLLSQLITNFDHLDSNGDVILPGKPVATIVAPAYTNVPASLSAAGTVFADTYAWEIIDSPAGSNPILSDADSITPTFNVSPVTNGAYTVQLTVTKSTGENDVKTQVINVDNTKPLPASIGFSDIETVLNNTCQYCHTVGESRPHSAGFSGTTQAGCQDCHSSRTTAFTINNTQDDTTLYNDIRERIDFADPLKSKLLLKVGGKGVIHGDERDPTSLNFSGFNLDSADAAGRTNYDLFMNWILEGAQQ